MVVMIFCLNCNKYTDGEPVHDVHALKRVKCLSCGNIQFGGFRE